MKYIATVALWITYMFVYRVLFPSGAGLLKLQGDIQSCGYADVQVMWEMLGAAESELTSRHIKHKESTVV